MPTRIPEEAAWHIEKADGYMDLKMWDRARSEIERVPEAHQMHPVYQQTLLRLAMEEEDWGPAAGLARMLTEKEPDQPVHWVQLAYATRRAYGIQEAKSVLLQAIEKFLEVGVISFNLACYECQLGHLSEALQYLEQAVGLEPASRALALEDEDLEPLWPELER